MKTRYEHFEAIIAKHQPETIVEIGVHEGRRAVYMIAEALRWKPRVHYFGYDVFDTKDAAFQEAALNGKGMAKEAVARHGMDLAVKAHGGKLEWSFVVGDTRETLAGQNVRADLVFIDGDHRLDAIRLDYEAVKNSKVVVFDDYYLPDLKGKRPDVSLYGCNGVVDAIPDAIILPHGDPTKHGGFAHLAIIAR